MPGSRPWLASGRLPVSHPEVHDQLTLGLSARLGSGCVRRMKPQSRCVATPSNFLIHQVTTSTNNRQTKDLIARGISTGGVPEISYYGQRCH
jgi:hypothetical protein